MPTVLAKGEYSTVRNIVRNNVRDIEQILCHPALTRTILVKDHLK